MQFDWSTFVLEVINLLVLVWLLKHFLYRPVLAMVERRRREIHDQLAEAEQKHRDAETLQSQYEDRLGDWEEEKRRAREELTLNLEQERVKRMQALEEELKQQRHKHASQDHQRQAQWRAEAENEALRLATTFSTRLLTTLAGPELDQRLQQLFVEQLKELPAATIARWRENWGSDSVSVEVISANVLKPEQQQQIRKALEQKTGLKNATWKFSEDPKLIAGLRVAIGGWLLRANLQDELRFFAEASHE